MNPQKDRLLFILLSLGVVGVLLLGSLSLSAAQSDEAEDSVFKHLAVFTEVVNLVRRAYVEETSVDALMAGALDGSTDALDPFSTYVPAGSVEAAVAAREVGDRLSGLTVARERGIAYVVAVAAGSPAAESGVAQGDVIAQIGGRNTRLVPLWEIQSVLGGAAGSEVQLDLLRRGEQEEATFVLADFERKATETGADQGVATLALHSLNPEVTLAVRTFLEDVRSSGGRRVLVDLRSTTGGDLEVAYAIGALFAQGDLGQLAGRAGSLKKFSSDEAPIWDGHLAVIVGRGTQGGAEVLAEILRQAAGAEVVGQRTFGHAGRQTAAVLSDGSRLFLTDGFYTGPDGEPIDGSLSPDLRVDELSRGLDEREISLEELTRRRALEHLLEREDATERQAA